MSCRICKVLEAQGNAVDLFEGHVSEFATGCPKFAAMGTEQRMLVAREAKYCINCMGKETKFSLSHIKDCPIKKKKNTYSCLRTLVLFICGFARNIIHLTRIIWKGSLSSYDLKLEFS